jgi:hypothetical protein
MIVPDSGSVHTVTNSKHAQLLTEPKSKEFFKPFLATERSVKQAAEEVGCDLNTMLYRVKAFQAAGLLKVTRTEKRKGREIKYYRSVHDAYFIPFRLTSYATLEERLEVQGEPIFATLIRAYAHALRQHDRFGNYVFKSPTGGVVTTDLVPDVLPSGLPVAYSDFAAYLHQDEALKVAEDLREVFKRGLEASKKVKPSDPKTHQYLLMIALLPVPK